MFDRDLLARGFGGVIDHCRLVLMEFLKDLLTHRENRLFMIYFIFMNMNRGYLKVVIPAGSDLIPDYFFVVFLEMYQQKV
jgi:hypothetical protein